VQLDPVAYGKPGPLRGTVVSPSAVARTNGTYWGYTVRRADSIQAVLDQCPYPEGKYDLTIGTSERGHESVDDDDFTLVKPERNSGKTVQQQQQKQQPLHYQHALIVFGGVAGIEECVDADERMKLSGANSHELFDRWINVCPFQGSRTIRAEEAVLITLARLSPFLTKAAALPDPKQGGKKVAKTNEISPTAVKFSDEPLSEESSDDDDDDDSNGSDHGKR
jgi:methyltransferase